MTWDEAKTMLHSCQCGCPSVSIYSQGNDDCLCYAECEFCHKTSESSMEPSDVVRSWNERGGPCSECDGTCDEPEDDLCAACWDRATHRRPNSLNPLTP
jgi:L-rhamnose mutarotase